MKSKPRILVVDDEDQNLCLMEAMLILLDYEVFLARDGMEALEAEADDFLTKLVNETELRARQ